MKLMPIAFATITASLGLAACNGQVSSEKADSQNITMAQCRKTPRASECQINGTVVEAYIGEMDPFVVSDVCVLFIEQDGSGKLWGLVEDIVSCSSTSRFMDREGAKVVFSKGEITYVADKAARDVFKDYRSEAIYHYLEGEVWEQDADIDPAVAISNAISLYEGADPNLTTKVELNDIPKAPASALAAEAETLDDRFPGTDYQAEVQGYYAIHPAVGDDTIVAYAFYAWGWGEPDYHDWIIFGVDLDGNVVHTDEDSG